MKRSIGFLAAAVPFLGLVTGTASAFAYGNSYGMDYTGGSDLENAVVEVDWTGDLDARGGYDGDTRNSLTFGNSTTVFWEDGYYSDGENTPCIPTRFFRVGRRDIGTTGGIYYTINGKDGYKIKVIIGQVLLDGVDIANDEDIAVHVGPVTGSIHANHMIYSDDTCTTAVDGIVKDTNGGLILVNTILKLTKPEDSNIIFDKMFLKLTDVDQGQSYKIVNEDSKLTSGNMYIARGSEVQPEEGDLKNMFSENNSYIYSETDPTTHKGFNLTDSNIYAPISADDIDTGLNVIFGFASYKSAASGIYFYQGKYEVKYVSDANGSITGKPDEGVTPGLNPTGSTSKAKTGYRFKRWVADKDVTLKDGTTITKGSSLSMVQIKNVVVRDDITFKAIHVTSETPKDDDDVPGEDTPEEDVPEEDEGIPTAPDTGGNFITDNGGAGLIACIVLPLSVIAGVAITTAYQRKKNHVRFNK